MLSALTRLRLCASYPKVYAFERGDAHDRSNHDADAVMRPRSGDVDIG